MNSEKTDKKNYSKYLFIIFFLAILTVAFMIARPFLPTLIISGVMAYIFMPVYKYFVSLTNMKRFSAIILILMLILVFSIPLIVLAGSITKQSYETYILAKEVFHETDIQNVCENDTSITCTAYRALSPFIKSALDGIASSVVSWTSDLILNIPKIILNFFIAMLSIYYMFIQGDSIVASLKNALPLKKDDSDRIVRHFNDIIRATIYGAIMAALLQGLFAGIGYLIFGTKIASPLILGMLTAIAAFVPFVGAAIVWLPVSVSMLVNGIISSDTSGIFKGLGLIIYGILVISTIDNLVRIKLVGDRARMHSLVLVIGVFGGMALFGFVGIIIGPLLLTLFIASLQIYQKEKEHFI